LSFNFGHRRIYFTMSATYASQNLVSVFASKPKMSYETVKYMKKSKTFASK